MKITVAKEAGFCFGVKRALDMTMSASEKGTKLQTFGELIHNSQVVEKLNEKGVFAIDQLNDFNGDALIVRSHGIGKHFYDEVARLNIPIIDGTCPYVKKIHNIVNEYSEKGYSIIIVGDALHPEVIGIAGWSSTQVYTADTASQALDIPNLQKACVVSQTTITQAKWESVMEILTEKIDNLLAFNTICSATQKRQVAADALSAESDLMLIVGGKHSSNTIKLYEVCRKNCKNSYHIETSEELRVLNFENCDKIGITAGASTPDWIINEIIFELEKF